VTPSQLALAWLLARWDEIVPIPGTRKRSHLEENIAALNIEMTWEDLLSINEAAQTSTPFGLPLLGDRYRAQTLIR
jgi:aryl-alcohol dehydrogenase-like predicted oxidoreductase